MAQVRPYIFSGDRLVKSAITDTVRWGGIGVGADPAATAGRINLVGGHLVQNAGDPNGSVTAPSGSICLDTTNAKLWINTDGSTTWTEFSTGGGGGVLGENFVSASSTAETSTTSSTFQQHLTLSTGSIPAGVYRLEFGYYIKHPTTSGFIETEVKIEQDDTTELHLGLFYESADARAEVVNGTRTLELSAGSYTFDMDVRRASGNQSSILGHGKLAFYRIG